MLRDTRARAGAENYVWPAQVRVRVSEGRYYLTRSVTASQLLKEQYNTSNERGSGVFSFNQAL